MQAEHARLARTRAERLEYSEVCEDFVDRTSTQEKGASHVATPLS